MNNNFITDETKCRSSFAVRNNFFRTKVIDMSQRTGAEVVVITYRDDGIVQNQHARPNVVQVMERYFQPNPPPLLALHRAVDYLVLEDLSPEQIQEVTANVETLVNLIRGKWGLNA